MEQLQKILASWPEASLEFPASILYGTMPPKGTNRQIHKEMTVPFSPADRRWVTFTSLGYSSNSCTKHRSQNYVPTSYHMRFSNKNRTLSGNLGSLHAVIFTSAPSRSIRCNTLAMFFVSSNPRWWLPNAGISSCFIIAIIPLAYCA